MAMIVSGEVDPTETPIIREINPKPFDPDQIDPENVVISYDRQSDTLIIHLFVRDRDTISVPVAKYLNVMVTPNTETIVGFHIEGFLAGVVKDVPASIELLDYAELRGITPAEVRALQSDTLGIQRWPAARWQGAAGRTMYERRKQAIASYIDAARSHWPMPFIPAIV